MACPSWNIPEVHAPCRQTCPSSEVRLCRPLLKTMRQPPLLPMAKAQGLTVAPMLLYHDQPLPSPGSMPPSQPSHTLFWSVLLLLLIATECLVLGGSARLTPTPPVVLCSIPLSPQSLLCLPLYPLTIIPSDFLPYHFIFFHNAYHFNILDNLFITFSVSLPPLEY